MTTFARDERTALCDLFDELGSDAPTLCAGWTTRDLAAHLVLREGRPDAALGILGGPLAARTESVQAEIASRPWHDLVRTVRTGPPRWSPQSITRLDAESNTVEFFVHHEDVRRAQPDWAPRELTAEQAAQLWPRIDRLAKLLMRKCPVGVVVEPTDGPAARTSKKWRAGDSVVTLRGPVGEIALAAFGRVTEGLTIEGDPADVEAFLSFPR